jgi:UDP-N-acetylmuramoylalanine--D-glutamate ligase
MAQKALILGLGASGKASARFLIEKGYEVIGVDSKEEVIKSDPDVQSLKAMGAVFVCDSEPVDFSGISFVVPSPGVPSSHPFFQEAIKRKIPVIGEAELAFQHMKQRAVAITGTNGKTTVTLLIEHILQSSGRKARALGNIGIPLTSYFLKPDPEEIVVAELSSYQLETMQTPVFDAAVLLNITPDHLDRYPSMLDYAHAKARLQHCVKPGASFYVFSPILSEFSSLFHTPYLTFGTDQDSDLKLEGQEVRFHEEIEYLLPIGYREKGMHDRLNALAAWALCKELGVKADEFIQHLTTFKKPAHRIEFVRRINGVDYFDDSKGTNIDAVIQAVGTMKGPVILIAGGVDKGASYLPWKHCFSGKVKQIFAIGQAATKIQGELGLFFNVRIVDSLAKAVSEASALAATGDQVLLSPGCSSFDMFRDYAHRGNEFQKFVSLLEGRSKK